MATKKKRTTNHSYLIRDYLTDLSPKHLKVRRVLSQLHQTPAKDWKPTLLKTAITLIGIGVTPSQTARLLSASILRHSRQPERDIALIYTVGENL